MLRRITRLTPADWRGIFIAYLYLLSSGWRIFVLREELGRWIVKESSSPGQNPCLEAAAQLVLRRQSRWINAAARYPLPWARCLQRSLALCIWLERKGFQTDLKIGVRKDREALKAHAWVEYQGRVINDSPHVSIEFAILISGDAGIAQTISQRDGR